MIDVAGLAARLLEAERAARPIPFPSETDPSIDWVTARAVARHNDALRRDIGEQLIGYKLGWTSAAMREALGIDRPNWGTLWEDHRASGVVALDRFIHPKIEPELVYLAQEDLRGTVDADTVRSAHGQWALGIEVVDPRFPSFAFDALDNTADNSSRAAVRVGSFAYVADVELSEMAVQFSASNVGEKRTGVGSQTMGAPQEAVAWLVRQLHEEDEWLRAGELVFTGGLTAPFDAAAGCDYTLTCPHLDPVRLRFD